MSYNYNVLHMVPHTERQDDHKVVEGKYVDRQAHWGDPRKLLWDGCGRTPRCRIAHLKCGHIYTQLMPSDSKPTYKVN